MSVIIDGIDVSSCSYHNTTYKDFECVNAHLDNECKNNPNCYYKQLKRAEQENEKLKKQYNCYACGNCKGKEDYKNLEKHHIGLGKQFDKYYHALMEIREIADGMHDWWINKTQYTDVYELAEHLLKTELNRVLNKINEVIGAEECQK